MRRITLQMYITLDGVDEFPEYPGSGDPPIEEKDTIAKEMWIKNWDSTDTILFSRKCYEQWADFWPVSKRKPSEHQFYHDMSRFAERAQKIVFSDSLKKTPWKNTRIMHGDLRGAVSRLRKEPGKNMALVGDTKLAQQFTQLGLIDDYFAYYQITVTLSFLNPAQFISLVNAYLAQVMSFVGIISTQNFPITPQDYGITIPAIVLTGALWIGIPLACFLYLAIKKD